jgi:hypothetical protein
MFGHNKRKRQRKEIKRERKDLKRERALFESQKPELERQQDENIQSQIGTQAAESKKARDVARQEGRKYSEDVISRDVQGLTPSQRNAMQYEANKTIQRAHQSANRQLLGEQSRHGIVGKGGVGYAQQRDLQRLANDARGQSQRDLERLNSDLSLKKLAAMFNIEQGEATQAQLDRQLASDELRLGQERKRQRQYEDQFNRLFSRV